MMILFGFNYDSAAAETARQPILQNDNETRNADTPFPFLAVSDGRFFVFIQCQLSILARFSDSAKTCSRKSDVHSNR